MKEETTADRIVALVGEMQKNSSEMRMWRNVPMAEECAELMRQLDTPEDTPLIKAKVCDLIVGHMPLYDVPRRVLAILRYEQQLLLQTDEATDHPTLESVAEAISRLEDYIDTEHVSDEEFGERWQRHLKADPIERTPLWEDAYLEVQEECDRRLGDTPRGMGFCFAHWSVMSAVLAERGIEWRSPAVMNPRVMFD